MASVLLFAKAKPRGLMNVAHCFRCCLNCGSLFPVKATFLCRQCWLMVRKDDSHRPFQRRILLQKIEGLSLWDWHPQRNDALSVLLAALKGWQGLSEWHFLAKLLVQKRALSSQKILKPDLIVPAPTLRPERQNHGLHLANALGELLQTPVVPMLTKTPLRGHQRGLNKIERRSLNVFRHEKFSQWNLSERRVLWVDDVLTTGETAGASLQALSPLHSYEIWCLAQRALI